jgi:YggT family protein
VSTSHERIVQTPAETEVVTTTTAPAAAVDRSVATAYDPFATRRQSAYRLIQAIYLLFGVLEALIAIRFVLRLLGANPNAGFAEFIYGITAPFIAPFVGLFGTPQANGSVLEIHSLVAIVVYALIAWLLTRLAWLAFGETRSAVRTSANSVETHS